jgi:hypothetical protein
MTESFYVALPATFNESYDLLLIDISGKIVDQKHNENYFDVSTYSQGVYLVKMRVKNEVLWTRRIIKR